MTADAGPFLYWIEDRQATVGPHIQILTDAQMSYCMYGTPSELINRLDEVATPEEVARSRIAFIVDIMLYGVSDLRSIGIFDAPTRHGVHAGYVFVDRYLRAADSRFAGIPVCFLTERLLDDKLNEDIEKLRNRGGGRIEIVQKYKDDEHEKFRSFIASL
jgi:hypothetical protein